MTVRELLLLNNFITDVSIEVRENGSLLVDALEIGLDYGVVPPYPTIIGQLSGKHKQGTYIRKSINTWDDGRDYWQIKVDRIPEKWLSLQVFSWSASHVYSTHHPRTDLTNSMEGIRITALPSGQTLDVVEKTEKNEQKQLEGQTDIFDFLEGTWKEN